MPPTALARENPVWQGFSPWCNMLPVNWMVWSTLILFLLGRAAGAEPRRTLEMPRCAQ